MAHTNIPVFHALHAAVMVGKKPKNWQSAKKQSALKFKREERLLHPHGLFLDSSPGRSSSWILAQSWIRATQNEEHQKERRSLCSASTRLRLKGHADGGRVHARTGALLIEGGLASQRTVLAESAGFFLGGGVKKK